ncbi:Hypothetical protein mma_2226 [Janthinobacterium sp. Marseille]|nr:ERF family protein [Janthinobacterium sp. Marseille]ABR91440.1 Hypothetical protein mma_2226 [Janthinobacterium sp. Marseille]
MKTSESVKQLAPALLAAQKAITFASKDSTNPHFKNKYADLPAVVEAIKEALNNAGIVFIQTPSPSTANTLELTTRLMHESGEWLEDTATIPLPKNDPQGYGSALTYGRRYALAAITGLYQDDDDGNGAALDVSAALASINKAGDMDKLKAHFEVAIAVLPKKDHPALIKAKDERKTALTQGQTA